MAEVSKLRFGSGELALWMIVIILLQLGWYGAELWTVFAGIAAFALPIFLMGRLSGLLDFREWRRFAFVAAGSYALGLIARLVHEGVFQ